MATTNRPPAPAPVPAERKLTPVPFVIDGFIPAKPRAWKAKDNAKIPTRVTAVLGAVTIRIAGSAVTFQSDVQIRIDDANAEPDAVISVPFDGKPFGSQPLFSSDDDKSTAEMSAFWAQARSAFLKHYASWSNAEKIDLATVNYASLIPLVKAGGSAVGKLR